MTKYNNSRGRARFQFSLFFSCSTKKTHYENWKQRRPLEFTKKHEKKILHRLNFSKTYKIPYAMRAHLLLVPPIVATRALFTSLRSERIFSWKSFADVSSSECACGALNFVS